MSVRQMNAVASLLQLGLLVSTVWAALMTRGLFGKPARAFWVGAVLVLPNLAVFVAVRAFDNAGGGNRFLAAAGAGWLVLLILIWMVRRRSKNGEFR